MAIPKLPPPPTNPNSVPEWLNQLYEWLGKASINGLKNSNGQVVMKAGEKPSDPKIAQALMPIPIGMQFAFNFTDSTREVIDGYWIWKSSVADDVTTASKYKFVKQSTDGGIYTFQDNTGAGVQAFYWVQAVNSAGESHKVTAGTASGSSLTGSETMTVLRPSASESATVGYANPAYAYDGNMNVESFAAILGIQAKATIWKGFPAASGVPTAVVLKVANYISPDSVGVNYGVSYSVDDGATWTAMGAGGGISNPDSVTLLAATDLTKLQVCAAAQGYIARTHTRVGEDIIIEEGSSGTHYVAEIWVEVTA